MNLANQLTILRILLAFLCSALIIKNTLFSLILSFLIFILASFTDYIDGLIARKNNLVSDLGKILDPIADKILVILVFLAFLELGVIHTWMVGIIILREFIITGVRIFALSKGVVLEAKKFGKHKTFSQMLAIVFIFLVLIFLNLSKDTSSRNLAQLFVDIVMVYVVLVTIFSGLYYLWANRRLIKTF
ncbi:MAG: CDP-diacylglycerol--glycerol-3-phosphate 3-phosphatidyltransferase [Candidatus Omnitrophica bacterium 4484_70.2]|nr:MAG: CDP-diacylglycerol--glycerol-3-phosphate 3-phosphatidyltransferase [Candidatus Omnitrophica bacterium 4484_70.2]